MSFVEQNLFNDVTFEIEKGDKVGFIGGNGVGKTTLFKIINGKLSPDSGQVFTASDTVVGYMEQHACSEGNRSVYDELISVFDYLMEMEKEIEVQNRIVDSSPMPSSEDIEKQTRLIEEYQRLGGLTYKSRTRSALSGFGFDEKYFDMPTGKLSGGQRSKLSLLKLLLSKSNMLLLDEPTNHLDIKAVNWLENFIKDFKGSMLIISHDRYFLDNVTNKTIELEHEKVMMYKGNYTEFKNKKKAYVESLTNKYENDLKEIKRIEGIVEQQKRWGREHNFITAASKQKEADRIKAQLVAPDSQLKTMRMNFTPKQTSGNDVLMCSNLSKSFDSKLFENVDLHIKRNERVFIIGENGCGKTTLFNMILGKIAPDSGSIDFGAQVDVGYFDQMQNNLDLNKTALDEIWDSFPNMTETQVRTALGSFLFSGDQVFIPLNKMSGGERARISLLKLMLGKNNFLLLDEPTNHLDSASREQLENTLSEYEGTMLIISHDRYFVNKLATRILDLTQNGMVEYLGNYDYYLEKNKDFENAKITNGDVEKKQSKGSSDYKQQKLEQAKERKRKNDLKKTEAKIEELDEKIATLNDMLQQDEITSDYAKLMELTNELEQMQEEQETLYTLWEELSE
ncbi:MAG: ABC-F family ATP-binding cassette domain-containing protein [Oscillospiraceae bacterium]|nr:ABC-F family ATP-binding cassette domain-containing protein [Oscillospiraceae bacterium]